MPDVASLSFDIDSSQAQRAIAVLQTLQATSISVTKSAAAQTTQTSALSTAYGQQVDVLNRLATATRTYDGTLSGLINRLNQTRSVMNQSQADMARYATTLVQVSAAAAQFGASIEGLNRFAAATRQLQVTAADTASGFERMTTVLRNQTAEAAQLRDTLRQLGVQYQDLGRNQQGVLLQRIAQRVGQVQLTPTNIAGFQQLFPGLDAQGLIALGAQPYVTEAQRRQQERTLAAQSQIDTQQAAIQRLQTTLARNEARRQDLASIYTQNQPSVWGRLGLPTFSDVGRFFTQSRDEQRAALERIEQLPQDQRRAHMLYTAAIGRAWQSGYPGQFIRNLTSGTYSANQAEIEARGQAESAASGWIGAFVRGQGRQIQNVLGLYTPVLNRPTGELTDLDRQMIRQGSAGILANYGDTALSRILDAEQRRNAFAGDTTLRNRYQAAFGTAEGGVRYANQAANLQLGLTYAQAPQQQLLDDARREALIQALPEAQRAQARFQLGFIGQLAGPAAIANMPAGTTLAGMLGAPALTGAQQQAGRTLFESQVGQQLQQRTEQNDEQLRFQRELAEALDRGRAAAEDFTRAYGAYRETLLSGAGEQRSVEQGLQALSVALAQRVTQGKALVQQEREENDVRSRMLDQARSLATADPIVRRTAELSLGIDTTQKEQINQGNLPNPAGGMFRGRAVGAPQAAAVVAADRAQRIQAAVQPGLEHALTLQTGAGDAVNDARQIANLMEQRNLSLSQATQELNTQKQFADDLARAQLDTTGAAEREVEARRQTTLELQRQAALEQARAQNLQGAQAAHAEGLSAGILAAAPPEMRPILQRFLPNLMQTLQANRPVAPLPTATPDERAAATRATQLRDQIRQSIIGITPEGAAAIAGSAYDETKVQGINEANPVIPGSRGGLGDWQWTGSRRDQFEAWAKAHNLDPNSQEASIGFLKDDLQRYPEILQALRTPGLSAAQQSANFLPYTAGSNIQLLSQAPQRAATATAIAGDATVAPGSPAAQSQLAYDSLVVRALQQVMSGQRPDVAGLPAAVGDSVMQFWRDTQYATTQGQGYQTTQMGTELAGRTLQAQRQARFAGQPGLQARIGPVDLTLPPDQQAQRQAIYAGGVSLQQSAEQRNAMAATEDTIKNQQRLAAAYKESSGAVEVLQARIQAENEAEQRALDAQTTNVRAHQLFTQALAEEGTSLAKTTADFEEQIKQQQALSEAASHGGLALRNAQSDAAAATEERRLASEKALTTDQAQIRTIDGLIAAVENLRDKQHQLNLEQAETAAATDAQRQRQQNRVTQAVTNLGPFASDRDIRHATAAQELQNRFDETPGLEQSPEGQQLKQATAQTQAIQDTAQRMAELRDAAKSAEDAIANTLDAFIVHGGKPQDYLRSLGQELESIALKTLVLQPLERMLNSIAEDVFGGGSGGGNAGGGTGNQGGAGAGGLVGQFANNLLLGGGGGAGGAASPGAAAGGAGSGTGGAATPAAAGGLLGQLISRAGSLFGGSGGPSMNAADYAMASTPLPADAAGPVLPAASAGGASQAGVGSSIFSHAGGAIGWGVDQLGGQGFYQGGGLIGSLFSSSGASTAATGASTAATGASGSLFSGIGDWVAGLFANGGAFPSARGNGGIGDHDSQIVYKPTLFRFAQGGSVGLMGEAGAEAVMPLQRGPDGRLGVTMQGSGGNNGGGPSVIMNIQTPDIDSFRASRSQIQSRAAAQLSTIATRNGMGRG